jgi:fructose-1-phosphate kinase PfkB-like protein
MVDTYGPPLQWFVAGRPALIKLNATELLSIGLTNLQPLPPGIQWVVTDGPRPVRIRTLDGREETLRPPIVQEVSATGSGDVLFACILHAFLHRRMSLLDAVAFALPYAAANAAHAGVADFTEPA